MQALNARGANTPTSASAAVGKFAPTLGSSFAATTAAVPGAAATASAAGAKGAGAAAAAAAAARKAAEALDEASSGAGVHPSSSL